MILVVIFVCVDSLFLFPRSERELIVVCLTVYSICMCCLIWLFQFAVLNGIRMYMDAVEKLVCAMISKQLFHNGLRTIGNLSSHLPALYLRLSDQLLILYGATIVSHLTKHIQGSRNGTRKVKHEFYCRSET